MGLAVAARSHADKRHPQIATEAAPTTLVKLRTCILPFGDEAESRSRFAALFAPVRTIAAPGELAECQLVVLPSGWLQHPDEIEAFETRMRAPIEAWVRRGGALLVFQPNPHPLDAASFTLFDTRIGVRTWYDAADRAEKIVAHPILENLDARDLSFPADQIVEYDRDRWTALVRGSATQSVSLLVGSFGRGRVAIDADNPARSPAQLAPDVHHSDVFVRAIVGWLVAGERERARVAR